MANDLINKPGLKLVPKPDPSSLTQEDRLLLLQRGNPMGGFRLDCGPVRPYLVVITTEAPDPTKEPGDSTIARLPQAVTSPSAPEAPVSATPPSSRRRVCGTPAFLATWNEVMSNSSPPPQAVTSRSTPEAAPPVSAAPRLWHQFCNRTHHFQAISDLPTSLPSPDSEG